MSNVIPVEVLTSKNLNFLSECKTDSTRIDCKDLKTVYVRGGSENKQSIQFSTSSTIDLYNSFDSEEGKNYAVHHKINVKKLIEFMVSTKEKLPFVIESSST